MFLLIDERIMSGSVMSGEKGKSSYKQNSKKNEKKEPKQRKPRELSVQKDINFFNSVKNDRKRNVKKNASKLNIICICGLVVIIGVSYLATLKLNSDVKSDIKAAERYINDPMIKIQMDNINKNKSDVEQIGRLASSAKVTHEAMIVRPLITSDILSSIIKCMPKTVTFTGIEYDNGVIVLSCKSKTDIVAADFANSLKGVEGFKSVTYESVSRSIDTVTNAAAVVEGTTGGFNEENVKLPTNVTSDSAGNSASISSSGENGIVSVLKKIATGNAVAPSTTNYKYDYNIIVTLDNAEVKADEAK